MSCRHLHSLRSAFKNRTPLGKHFWPGYSGQDFLTFAWWKKIGLSFRRHLPACSCLKCDTEYRSCSFKSRPEFIEAKIHQPIKQNKCTRQNIVVNQKPKKSVHWNTSRLHTASGMPQCSTVPTVPLRAWDDALCSSWMLTACFFTFWGMHCVTEFTLCFILSCPKQTVPVPSSPKDMKHGGP